MSHSIDSALLSDSRAPALLPTPPLVGGGLPLLGSLPALLRHQAELFTTARARYGDIYTMRFGPLSTIIVNHPRHIQHVFRDASANYGKGGALWKSIRTLLGNGLGVSEGDYWLRQRRMMQRHFHRESIDALVTGMVDAIDEELATWDAAAETGTPLSPMRAFSALVMKLIARTLFGGDISREDAERITTSATFAFGHIFRGIIAQELPPWIPIPGRRRYRRALHDIDAVLSKIVERGQRRDGRGEANGSLLASLIDMVDPETGQRMSASQVRDEVMTLFLAGYESSAVGLSWTLHLLLREPAALAELRAEVDAVLGGDRPEASHLDKLVYTRMVFQEALRIYPPLWWLARVALADDTLDGFRIPAGTLVLAPVYAVHRHPEFWEDPERFDPGRFTPERVASRHRLAWIPFGTGQRQCIGKDFALVEAQLILARLVQRYTFAAVPSARPTVPVLSMTLRMKNEVQFLVKRRSAP